MSFANRVKTLSPSTTLQITSKAKALKDEGHDVVGLGAGEPDFNTPKYIIDAAKRAMDDGLTKYTPAGGVIELKDAIINKFKKDQNLTYNRQEIIVTTGAKHALYTLFQVILNKGDEVIVPVPYWVSYPEQIKLAEGKPVFVNTSEQHDFKLTPEELEKAITSKTKAIILNSPSNPTGVIYNESELLQIGKIALKHNLWIISDEIYEKLIYGSKKHVSIATLSDELKEKTVIINGVSKSHAMTGWRIGYAAGDEKLIKAMTNLASHATSNPTSIAQYATIAAYENDDAEELKAMKNAFEERLNWLYHSLIDIPNLSCVKPDGAFYVFPNVKKIVEQSPFNSTDEWVAQLLEEEKLAIVPGSAFGAADYVRLSYATSLDILEEAVERLKRFVNKYS